MPEKRYVLVVNAKKLELVFCSSGYPQCSGGVALGRVTTCHSEGDFAGSLSLLKSEYGNNQKH